MTNRQRLGELLIQQNIVSQDIVDQALRTQVGGNRRLGHILVRMQAITDDQLAETLANQLDISLCDIAYRFSPEASKMVPRYLCRQYSILPLALKDNNILEVAMANPADEEAKVDIENYTGRVIQPFLARHSDIEREITRRIPMGVKDVFSPRLNNKVARIGIAACLVLITLLGGFTYQYIQTATYGTVSVTDSLTIWKNHDLMLGIDKQGTINLLGRGAFAGGYYSVTFNDPSALSSFIAGRAKDLSNKQKDWLDWAAVEVQAKYLSRALAVKQ